MAQHQGLWESHIYELELPREIQNRILETEKCLWEEFDSQKLKDECKKVEYWILDLGNTVGQVRLYEKTVAVYWLMKNLGIDKMMI